MNHNLSKVSRHFKFEGVIKEISLFGNGLINDTYFVETIDSNPNYILQRKNKNIFQNVPAMMDNIHKVTSHLKNKTKEIEGDPRSETLTLIETTDGKLFHKDADGEYWTGCLYIPDTITFEKADSLSLAEQGGIGIGKFQRMLADMQDPLTDILPGFHNIKYRFNQWDETLSKDFSNRKSEVKEEIEWIESRRAEMLAFWAKVESGVIPTRVTHNDTKISNILFSQDKTALCVIDLDTVLNSTCLNDYGDAIRSYANAGLEDDDNLQNVYLDMEIFEAYTKGYLSESHKFLVPSEIENIAFSAKYITFEQTLRFLMDYIDGDIYYKIKNKNHNLVRTHAQYKLLQSMEDNFERMSRFIEDEIRGLKNEPK